MDAYPLSQVQVIWEPSERDLPQAKLVQRGREDDDRYLSSWGACNQDFNSATPDEQANMLMRQFVHMTAIDGLDPVELHNLFMAIPEYRRALEASGSLDPAVA